MNQKTIWAILLCLLSTLQGGAAQFVDVTVEIEIYQSPAGHFTKTVHFLVGTNSWQMDGEFLQGAKSTAWFTGASIIENEELPHLPRTNQTLVNWKEGATGESSSFVQVATPHGQRWTSQFECLDGNPCRQHKMDVLTLQGRIGWLAFCSGPFLKRSGRQIFPPSDIWKEVISAPTGFSDRTAVFEDSLGLPKHLELYTTNNQPVLQYHVLSSTNVLSWEFPLEFYLAQYSPIYQAPESQHIENRGWELYISAKGKVTAIGPGNQPQIPLEVMKTAQK
jgi:hypothetical protein